MTIVISSVKILVYIYIVEIYYFIISHYKERGDTNRMKTFSAIKKSIENRLTELTGQEITNGSVIDLYNIALSEHLHDIYQEIENSKNRN